MRLKELIEALLHRPEGALQPSPLALPPTLCPPGETVEIRIFPLITCQVDELVLAYPTARAVQVHRVQCGQMVVNDIDLQPFPGRRYAPDMRQGALALGTVCRAHQGLMVELENVSGAMVTCEGTFIVRYVP